MRSFRSAVSLIARFMGPTGPRWAPCWPHEPCYLGCVIHLGAISQQVPQLLFCTMTLKTMLLELLPKPRGQWDKMSETEVKLDGSTYIPSDVVYTLRPKLWNCSVWKIRISSPLRCSIYLRNKNINLYVFSHVQHLNVARSWNPSLQYGQIFFRCRQMGEL